MTKRVDWDSTMGCNDVLVSAMAFLDARSLIKLSCVDRSTNRCGEGTARLWVELLYQRYPRQFHSWKQAMPCVTTARSIFKCAWLGEQADHSARRKESIDAKDHAFNLVASQALQLVGIATFLMTLVGVWIEAQFFGRHITMRSLWPAWISATTTVIALFRNGAHTNTRQSYYYMTFVQLAALAGWMAVLRATECIACAWWMAVGLPWLLASYHTICNAPTRHIRDLRQSNPENEAAFIAAFIAAFTTFGFCVILSTVAALVFKADHLVSENAYSWTSALIPLFCFNGFVALMLPTSYVYGGENINVLVLAWFLLASSFSALSMVHPAQNVNWMSLNVLLTCLPTTIAYIVQLRIDLSRSLFFVRVALQPVPPLVIADHNRKICPCFDGRCTARIPCSTYNFSSSAQDFVISVQT